MKPLFIFLITILLYGINSFSQTGEVSGSIGFHGPGEGRECRGRDCEGRGDRGDRGGRDDHRGEPGRGGFPPPPFPPRDDRGDHGNDQRESGNLGFAVSQLRQETEQLNYAVQGSRVLDYSAKRASSEFANVVMSLDNCVRSFYGRCQGEFNQMNYSWRSLNIEIREDSRMERNIMVYFQRTRQSVLEVNRVFREEPEYPPTYPPQGEMMDVFSFSNGIDNLLTLEYNEGLQIGYRFQGRMFKVLTMENYAMATMPLFRCVMNGYNMAYHFVATNQNCDGHYFEGQLGFIFSRQSQNSVPLYKFMNPNQPYNIMVTTDINAGNQRRFIYQGVIGFAPIY